MTIEAQLFRLNRCLNVLAQKSELSSARFQVLQLIKQHNPITLSQLCEFQKVTMPTMSKLVDELQNEALVIRAQSKDDARQRWIVPTQKGIQVLAKVSKSNQQFWQGKLGGLTIKEQKELELSLKVLNGLLVLESDS